MSVQARDCSFLAKLSGSAVVDVARAADFTVDVPAVCAAVREHKVRDSWLVVTLGFDRVLAVAQQPHRNPALHCGRGGHSA
jgi:hypothetical protein